MLILFLLLLALGLVFFAQRLLFRRLWNKNLDVRLDFDGGYLF